VAARLPGIKYGSKKNHEIEIFDMSFFGLIDIDNEYRCGSFRSPFVLGLEEICDSFLFGDEVAADLPI